MMRYQEQVFPIDSCVLMDHMVVCCSLQAMLT
jgi:hypothetical protein